MTRDERADLKIAVKEAVHEQVPETLAEILSPMVRHNVRAALNNYRRMVAVSWVVTVIAVAILFIEIFDVAGDNTRANRRQDCVLAGLVRGVEREDRRDAPLFNLVLRRLDPSAGCPHFTIPAPAPPH
jgi:hypothetical protein